MGFAAVVHDEDHRLRNSREEHNNSVDEGLLELSVGTDVLVFLEHVLEPDLVQGVVVHCQEDDDLPEEGDSEPRSEDGVRRADVRDLAQGFGVRKEVKVDGGEHAEDEGLRLRVFEVGEVHLCETVGLNHRGNRQDFVGLDGGHERSDCLSDDDEDALDRVGVLGREGSSDAGVSELDFVVTDAHSADLCALSHAFLIHLVH